VNILSRVRIFYRIKKLTDEVKELQKQVDILQHLSQLEYWDPYMKVYMSYDGKYSPTAVMSVREAVKAIMRELDLELSYSHPSQASLTLKKRQDEAAKSESNPSSSIADQGKKNGLRSSGGYEPGTTVPSSLLSPTREV